jgi:hypothetical protein
VRGHKIRKNALIRGCAKKTMQHRSDIARELKKGVLGMRAIKRGVLGMRAIKRDVLSHFIAFYRILSILS